MANSNVKTYKAKSSATRAAKKALEKFPKGSTFEVFEAEDGTFGFLVKAAEDGIKRSSDFSGACSAVWDIAEEMEGARRKDIIETCVQRGIAFYTARTQYQKYLEAKRAK